MPLTDSQMVGLLDFVLAQQRDIYMLQGFVYSLAQVARELAGAEAGDRIVALQKKYEQDIRSKGARDVIELLEKAVLQLRHASDPVN